MTYNQADSQTPEDQPGQGTDPDTQFDVKFTGTNIAEHLDEDRLAEIGETCKRGFEQDLKSRGEWEDEVDEWTKLAKQTREPKTFPWPNASNVKYPLLSTAAMQFAARAYPSLLPSNGQIVNCTVIGKDPDGQKLEKANRVSTYMSYQLLDEMYGWEESMDKLLIMLPVVGTLFKKTWYDKTCDCVRSEVILPKNLVVNYWATNLCTVERISEIIEMSPRILKEKQRMGVFLDIDLGDPPVPENVNYEQQTTSDETTPYQIIEQHTFIDLDDDDYPEPCIVNFERVSGKVLGIYLRYLKENITMKPDGKSIGRIEPTQMYTKFGFIPNPDGSFYDVGFGSLLGPINESVNTGINILNDAGTASNLQSGFIGKGMRIKMGDARMTPGEWRPVNSVADDIRKQIVPLPMKEPSGTIYQLVELLITSGKELASVAEIFTGKMPGQNTPATTTMASIEQGMKVFTAVYKRIYRALSEEFDKIFNLNHMYLDPQKYIDVLDMQVDPSDFDNTSCDIKPGADPTASSQTEKLMKAQALGELMQMFGPILNPVEVCKRMLDAQEQPQPDALLSQQVQQTGMPPPPPPDPKVLAIQAQVQGKQQEAQIKSTQTQQQMAMDQQSHQAEMAMEAQKHAQDMQANQQELIQKAQIAHADGQIKMASALQQAHTQAQQGQMQLKQSQETHEQKIQQAKETSQLQRQSMNAKSSKTGKTTR